MARATLRTPGSPTMLPLILAMASSVVHAPAPIGEQPAPIEPATAEAVPGERSDAPAEPDPPPDETAQLRAEQAQTAARVAELERDNAELRRAAEQERVAAEKERAEIRRQLEELREGQEETKTHVRRLLPLEGRMGGYIDVGLFRVAGDGSGVRPDIGYRSFPEYEGVISDQWVFMGDPLSTAINSRGEPADTGPSRALLFDPIGAGSNPTLIVNALNLNAHVSFGRGFSVGALVDFLPRNRDVAREDTPFLGDYIDIKRAQLRWAAPAHRYDLDVYLGKIDSVFGHEYRYQEAPFRTTVTPSLLCRYTCGRPTGVSTRWKFLPRRSLIVNASVTNGSTVQETFGFANEIDANAFKTVTSRVAYRAPVGTGLEIGASGEVGAQDLQPRNDRLHWQYGFDVHLAIKGLELTGEFVQVRMQGQTAPGRQNCGLASCLRVLAAYGLAGYRVTNWAMPYFRTDWRDALYEGGANFVYIAELIRFTPGVRFDVGEHVAIKAEYTFNRELGRIPQFHNDVVTSSVVAYF